MSFNEGACTTSLGLININTTHLSNYYIEVANLDTLMFVSKTHFNNHCLGIADLDTIGSMYGCGLMRVYHVLEKLSASCNAAIEQIPPLGNLCPVI